MSDAADAKYAPVREELRSRVHKLLDRRGKMVGSYGRPERPHLVLDTDGIEMHRDDFGMRVYTFGQLVYSEIRDERCMNLDHKRAEEVVGKLRKLMVLEDLSNSG